jgi:peptidylprolyl isomerase
MIKRILVTGTAALFLMGAAPVTQQGSAGQASPQEVLDAAPASAWTDVQPDDLVIMTLADGSKVTYQLASPFTPVHVANIRQLVRSGYFDDASIIRVQDAYVVQWGRADDDKTEAKGINATPPAEYEFAAPGAFKALPYRDAYAEKVGHIKSWPVASDGKANWLIHCYGMIGVARDVAPDTGSGTQLYTVIGHAPRHLDRNLAVVGRIIGGMEFLTNRPRGTEELGFFKDDSQRIRIVSTKMASDLPAAERPAYQVMDNDSQSFSAWVKARANRSGAFFVHSAGAVDICNAQAPIRLKPIK